MRKYTSFRATILLILCFIVLYFPIISNGNNSSSQTPIIFSKIGSFPLNNLIWNSTFGGPYADGSYSIIRCKEGGYLLAGETARESPTQTNLWLIRIDELGNTLWQYTFGGSQMTTCTEVIECSSGGFAIIGSVLTTNSTFDMLILRIDANGGHLWNATFGGTEDDLGNDLIEVRSGGFALVGSTESFGAGADDFWLVRVDTDGELLWNVTYGGVHQDVCTSIIESYYGGFVIAGYTRSFGALDFDMIIIRTSYSGESISQRLYGEWGRDICMDIIENSNRGYALVGYIELTNGLSSDAILINTLSNGELEWECRIAGPYWYRGYSVVECQTGGFAITGVTNFDTQDTDITNLWVARINPSGSLLWKKRFGGGLSDSGESIIQSFNGDFVICGITWSYGNGQSDAWLLRILDRGKESSIFDQFTNPNFGYIGLGLVLAIVMILGSFLLYSQSKKEITATWQEPSKNLLRRLFRMEMLETQVAPVLLDFNKCPKCNALNPKSHLVCWGCDSELHTCMVCKHPIQRNEKVLYCPNCGGMAHQNHLQNWLQTKRICPNCRSLLSLSHKIKR